MKILEAVTCPISGFEVYGVVAEELSKLPLKHSELSESALRRNFCWLAVLEQLERQNAAVPALSTLKLSDRQRAALEVHGVQASPNLKLVAQADLERCLEHLHRTYKLTQGELLQISDLMPEQLVDLYAITESCSTRFDEETMNAFLNDLRSNLVRISSSAASETGNIDLTNED